MKECEQCKQSKPYSEFVLYKSSNRFSKFCKECISENNRIKRRLLCPKCNQYKLKIEFHKRKSSINGRNYYCKDCANKMASEYLKANKAIQEYQNKKRAMNAELKKLKKEARDKYKNS